MKTIIKLDEFKKFQYCPQCRTKSLFSQYEKVCKKCQIEIRTEESNGEQNG